MYTKTKIQNLNKNNKILYEKYGWKIVAVFDYNGLIAEAIFNNHFTKTCLRKKDVFEDYSKKYIKLPIYIIKNDEKHYYRQIEFYKNKKIKFFNEDNCPTGVKKNEIPKDIIKIIGIKESKKNEIFLDNCLHLFKNKKFCNKLQIEKIKKVNIFGKNFPAFKISNNNDYCIICNNVFINNTNNNPIILQYFLKNLNSIKHTKTIKEILYLITKNTKIIFL